MGPAAARINDKTAHPGMISGPGIPSVVIGGLAAAVATQDTHTCALAPPVGPHPPGNFPVGSKTVFIGGFPALRVGDISSCGAPILTGASNVIIGG